MTDADIVEYLTARYDEEQRLAEAATPGPWTVGGELLAPYLPRDFVHAPHYKPEGFSQGQHVGDASVADGGMGPWAVSVRDSGFPFANAQHIACHDPARVLADIAAKRKHLERYAAARRIHEAMLQQDAKNDAPWVITDHAAKCTYITTSAAHSSEALGILHTWEEVLRLDAAPYAERPGFRPEWKIDD